MVLFSNINLNQNVELRFQEMIIKGVVKYKGSITGKDGDWVGVGMSDPVGRHNGIYRGRRYFDCKQGHGIFVRAHDLRLIQNTKRSLFHKYHKTVLDSQVDEELFGRAENPLFSDPRDPIYISEDYNKDKQQSALKKSHREFMTTRSFGLNHSISRTVPAATMTRPRTAAACYTYTSAPVHHRQNPDEEPWERSPSIPKTHMPHSAQKNQTKRGWENSHWTRELTDHKARESMKMNNWNDISF